MRITTIHHYDAPSNSDFKHAVELGGEDIKIEIMTKSKEDLTKLINGLLILVNLKEKEDQK